MEFGTLQRQIHVGASPEIVFAVITQPEHIREWWPDEVSLEAAPGAMGELVWGDRVKVAPIAVVDVEPPRRFSFRWTAPDGETPQAGNSLLVTFELEPSATGTLLRLSESGFRQKGWEIAVLEEAFRDHERGWDLFLPRLKTYATTLVPAR
jgi:uncharacterized protein YndB with AHSA1/START domain